MTLFTFQDAFDSLLAYLGGAPSDQNLRDCRQAIDEALRELIGAHNWSYYYKFGRINLHGPFNQGTIQFQVDAGSAPNLVTLTGSTWPTWAADGYMRIGNVIYRVDRVLDPTHLTLLGTATDERNAQLAPVVDLPSGTQYFLYCDSYLLPPDFRAGDQSLYEHVFGPLQFVHPRSWLFGHRWIFSTGIPREYSITGDEKAPNRLLVRFSPLPSESRTMDFIFQRTPRPLRWQNEHNGTVFTIAGQTRVTGQGTTFDSTMSGSVLRISSTQAQPTWLPGKSPAVYESIVDTVTDTATLDVMPLTPPANSYSSVGYTISDMIDIETQSMLNAFMRCSESKLANHRTFKERPSARLQYQEELRRAREMDSRSFAGRAEGDIDFYRMRLKNMPLGVDMS